MKNKRYTLAVRHLEDGKIASSVLAEFLGILEDFDLELKPHLSIANSTTVIV